MVSQPRTNNQDTTKTVKVDINNFNKLLNEFDTQRAKIAEYENLIKVYESNKLRDLREDSLTDQEIQNWYTRVQNDSIIRVALLNDIRYLSGQAETGDKLLTAATAYSLGHAAGLPQWQCFVVAGVVYIVQEYVTGPIIRIFHFELPANILRKVGL